MTFTAGQAQTNAYPKKCFRVEPHEHSGGYVNTETKGFRALFFYLHVCTTPKPDFQVFNFETFHLLKIIFDTVNTCIIDLSR